MGNTAYAIQTDNLRKVFGRKPVLDGVNIRIPPGTLFALLGPNGAGKTTLVRILSTLLRQDSGCAWILGLETQSQSQKVRRRISVTGQDTSVDEDLTGRENLQIAAKLKGYRGKVARNRADELLERFDLQAAASKVVKRFSGGMRRKLDLAASLVALPEVLFLDEPTTGLDPHSRIAVWEVIRAAVSSGSTVLLTTQYLEEADHLADMVAVMRDGEVIAAGTAESLKQSIGSSVLKIRARDSGTREHLRRLTERYGGPSMTSESDPTIVSVQVPDAARAAEVASRLSEGNDGILEFSYGHATLDDVFLSLTGRGSKTHAGVPSGRHNYQGGSNR